MLYACARVRSVFAVVASSCSWSHHGEVVVWCACVLLLECVLLAGILVYLTSSWYLLLNMICYTLHTHTHTHTRIHVHVKFVLVALSFDKCSAMIDLTSSFKYIYIYIYIYIYMLAIRCARFNIHILHIF